MNELSWIILGITLGIIASILDPRLSEGGILGGMFVGTVGAFIGGVVANLLLEGNIITSHPVAVVLAGAGAISLLLIRKAERYF